MHARGILEELNVNVSVRTVQRVLSRDEHMIFRPMKVRPHLTADHKKRRLLWAREHDFVPSSRWRRTVFTDEKRFCLDGPDGSACFWADRRVDTDIFTKRARGGGGVMVWAGISWKGKTSLVVVNGNLNSEEYISMLEEHLLPFTEEKYPQGFIFQQDGAPAHTSQATRDFF